MVWCANSFLEGYTEANIADSEEKSTSEYLFTFTGGDVL